MGLKDIGFGCTVSNYNSGDMLKLYQLSLSMGLEFATAAFTILIISIRGITRLQTMTRCVETSENSSTGS